MKLFKASKLTPIEVPAVPGCEGLLEDSNKPEEVTVSTEGYTNDNPPQSQPNQKQPPPFQFVIREQEGNLGHREFFFYLNEPAYFSEVMQLSNLIATCTDKDVIYISLGGVVSMNAANLLVSVLKNIPAKVIMDAPCIYNIYAGAVLTTADHIRISPYMTAVYDYPQMSAGGGQCDAEEAIKFNKQNFMFTTALLVTAGFLTQEEADKLCKQNLVTVSGDELIKRYEAFNSKDKSATSSVAQDASNMLKIIEETTKEQ